MKNINKGIFITGITSTLLFSAIFVYAQTYNQTSAVKPQSTTSGQTSQQIQKLRDEAQARIQQIRLDLKQKINQIQDKAKKDLANKIMDQIDHVNKVWTDHFINVLNKLDTVLQKIKSRAQKAGTMGQDVSTVNTAVEKAEAAIASARSAVLNQSERTYAINVSTITGETSTATGQGNLVGTFRTRFQLLKDQVLKDLSALRDGVMKDARTAVKDAFKALSQVPNVDKEPTAK